MRATHPLWRPFDPPDDRAIAAARVGTWQPAPVTVVDADPRWPAAFQALRREIEQVLGPTAISVAHMGSTSVPGLPAKDVLDVDLAVPDPAAEETYVPPLERIGFALRVREPEWDEHRMLRRPRPTTHLHVFPPGAPELRRHLMFRDWLRTHPDERDAYAAHKLEVAARGYTDGMHYNNAKAAFVYDLYERIFVADPEHRHDPRPRDRAGDGLGEGS